MQDLSNVTPMLRQYFELKKEAEGAVLFFRMGDFYEIFGEDAEDIAPKLDVVLTAREKGDQTKIPFCGVPHHAATGYWLKLIKLGYKVAIVEQLEEASPGKGLVKRGIVRTYTPGSINELEGLDRNEPNFLVAVSEIPNESAFAFVACDVSTGEFRLGSVKAEQLIPTIRNFRPKEVLTRRFALEALKLKLKDVVEENPIRFDVLPELPIKDEAVQAQVLLKTFNTKDLSSLPCGAVSSGAGLTASVLQYIINLQASTAQFLRIDPLFATGTMILSDTAIRDLEIFETSRRRQTDGSLAKVIDRTLSPMGARFLRHSLCNPYAVLEPIVKRHAAVEQLQKLGEGFLASIRDEMRQVADIARLSSRLVTGSTSPHELTMIRNTLNRASAISKTLLDASCKDQALKNLAMNLVKGDRVLAEISAALIPEPQALGFGRGVFLPGFDKVLDDKTQLALNGESRVNDYEQKLRGETGISSLKIKEHKTFGLLIEVTKSNFAKVPSTFIRRQTMVNCERYATAELNELSEDLQSASDVAIARERELFVALIESLKAHREALLLVSSSLGELDMLQSFAWIATKENWCRPLINNESKRNLKIIGGRHPVVEKFVGRHNFSANDVVMTQDTSHLLITGPNMAGKSTVMRQTALMVILAQAGSFVPAASAAMPLFDRVFTRVGAGDDLSRGQSTFMVEMTEAAEILRQATDKSLVILDEVGRGTSTADGFAIATAILEDLVDRVKCFSLFATHFHELVPALANRSSVVAVQTEVIEKDNREILFTHRLIPGASGSSFGIEVARLAGVPNSVISRAREQLTASKIETPEAPVLNKKPAANISKVQRDLFGLDSTPAAHKSSETQAKVANHIEKILEKLESVKIHKTTPLQALNILDELKRQLVPHTQRGLFGEDVHTSQ